MTRSQLRSLCRDYVQEASTVPLTDALINDLLTQGEERLSDLAEYSAAKLTQTFVLNDFDYELPSELLSILSVAWNDADGDVVPIAGPTSHQRMDEEFGDWRTDAADRPLRWWLLGNAILIHPKPSATYAGTTLELYGTIVPPAMAGESSEPTDLPLRWHRTLSKYAAWKWMAMDKENPTAQRLASFWQGEFQYDAGRLRLFIDANRTRTDGFAPRVVFDRDTVPTGLVADVEDQ